jgi:hypothetical protein
MSQFWRLEFLFGSYPWKICGPVSLTNANSTFLDKFNCRLLGRDAVYLIHDIIYLLTAIGLTTGGSSKVRTDVSEEPVACV